MRNLENNLSPCHESTRVSIRSTLFSIRFRIARWLLLHRLRYLTQAQLHSSSITIMSIFLLQPTDCAHILVERLQGCWDELAAYSSRASRHKAFGVHTHSISSMQTRASVGRLLESRLGRALHAAEALTLVTGLSQALALLYPSTEHQRQRLIHSEPDGSTEEAACVALTQVWDAANEASPTPSPADRDNYVAAFVEELMEGCAHVAAASFISAVWVDDEDGRVTHSAPLTEHARYQSLTAAHDLEGDGPDRGRRQAGVGSPERHAGIPLASAIPAFAVPTSVVAASAMPASAMPASGVAASGVLASHVPTFAVLASGVAASGVAASTVPESATAAPMMVAGLDTATGWKMAIDPNSGHPFYANASTGEMQWHPPEVAVLFHPGAPEQLQVTTSQVSQDGYMDPAPPVEPPHGTPR